MSHDERAGSVLRAFRLIHDVQAGLPGAEEGLTALCARARAQSWDDLERICLFGEAVKRWISGEASAAEPVAELIEASGAAGDGVMLALGLALRSDQGFTGADLRETALHDADLARAMVMLEHETGRPCERITAHTACAIALGNRWLFELSSEQYEAALAIGAGEPEGSIDFLLAPIRFNLAEQQVWWAGKLYELGDGAGVGARLDAWHQVATATKAYAITESWQTELSALELVLKAMAGLEVGEEAAELIAGLGHAGGEEIRSAGLLRLAVALEAARGKEEAHLETAREAIVTAIGSISPSVHPFMYDLALFVAAELEARPGSDAGLRYARRVLEEQWTKREGALRAMHAQVASVRILSERDLLSRHARLDDLTGIANRRALEEFLSDLSLRGVERCGVVLFDVDAFKAVNDLHGHLVGDRMLVRIAEVLSRGVRSSDLAVRLGGDEFAVVLADVDPGEATAVAEALVAAFDDEPLSELAEGLRLRVSAGVAVGRTSSIMEIWEAADVALYEAKADGGHRIRLAARLDG